MPDFPTPRLGALNDFTTLQPAIIQVAQDTGLPYEVLVAQSYQESSWKLKAYRYEPNYDRRYISGNPRWKRSPAWITVGPTCNEWFAKYPIRAGAEKQKGKDYSYVAQTRIAASYGPFQLMFPTAQVIGYLGLPEGLYDAKTSVALGAKLLSSQYKKLREKWPHKEALMIALARYNGGAVGNEFPTTLRNIDYVRHINRRHLQCWGTALFPGV